MITLDKGMDKEKYDDITWKVEEPNFNTFNIVVEILEEKGIEYVRYE
jgi:hypothetical protein